MKVVANVLIAGIIITRVIGEISSSCLQLDAQTGLLR